MKQNSIDKSEAASKTTTGSCKSESTNNNIDAASLLSFDNKIVVSKNELSDINKILKDKNKKLKKISEQYLYIFESNKRCFYEAFEIKIYEIENAIKNLEKCKTILMNKIKNETSKNG